MTSFQSNRILILLYLSLFNLLGKVTANIYREKTKAIAVIPKRPMQHGYPRLLKEATRNMITAPSIKTLVQLQDPQKVHPLYWKLHLWTNQDTINALLRQSTSQKNLPYQTYWKEYCVESNIVYDSTTVEQFLSIFKKLFNQTVSDSVRVHVFRMKYQNIPHHTLVIKYFEETLNLKYDYKTYFCLGCASYVLVFENSKREIVKSQTNICHTNS